MQLKDPLKQHRVQPQVLLNDGVSNWPVVARRSHFFQERASVPVQDQPALGLYRPPVPAAQASASTQRRKSAVLNRRPLHRRAAFAKLVLSRDRRALAKQMQ